MRKGSNILKTVKKGIQGFVPYENREEIKSTYLRFRCTKEEKEKVDSYCKTHSVSFAELIRERLKDIL